MFRALLNALRQGKPQFNTIAETEQRGTINTLLCAHIHVHRTEDTINPLRSLRLKEYPRGRKLTMKSTAFYWTSIYSEHISRVAVLCLYANILVSEPWLAKPCARQLFCSKLTLFKSKRVSTGLTHALCAICMDWYNLLNPDKVPCRWDFR